jgi:hypothetical protein
MNCSSSSVDKSVITLRLCFSTSICLGSLLHDHRSMHGNPRLIFFYMKENFISSSEWKRSQQHRSEMVLQQHRSNVFICFWTLSIKWKQFPNRLSPWRVQILQQGDMHALLKKAIAGVLLRTISNTTPCAWMETAARPTPRARSGAIVGAKWSHIHNAQGAGDLHRL